MVREVMGCFREFKNNALRRSLTRRVTFGSYRTMPVRLHDSDIKHS